MARDVDGSGFGRSHTFRLDRTASTASTSCWERLHMPNISKTHLAIGCVVFFLACMIIILVALAVTIATHRYFYYNVAPAGSPGGPAGGGGPDGGGPGPSEPDIITDIPCPVQTVEDCEKHGCKAMPDPGHGGATRCFLRDDAFGYRYRHTTYGDREVNYSLTYDMTSQGPFADDVINNVRVQAVYITEDTLRLRIHDEDRRRYEVPVLDDSPLMRSPPAVDRSRLRYLIEANETRRGRARLRVLRSDNYVVMLDSWHLVMTEQFLQVVLPYSGEQLYGFGESGHEHINLAMGSGTMFSRRVSNYSATDDANANWDNFAGVHPFFMNPKGDGTAWGVLILNSNAMDYTVTSGGNIAIATTGGILDLYFFVGSTPAQVVQQYQKLVGLPFMPPIWALGYQVWMTNYTSLNEVRGAVTALDQAGLPKDMIWLDVFQDSKAFTLNSAFGGLQTYVRQLASAGVQVGLVTNPAIPADNVTRYAPYTTGLEDDVFVKRGSGTSGSDPNAVLYAKGLPSGPSAFPDFLKNSTRQWWRNTILDYQESTVDFDAMFLRMNEPAEFSGSASCQQNDVWCQVCPQSRWEYPPYVPVAYRTEEGNATQLHNGTLCMNAAFGERLRYRHYDVHSIYGWSHSMATQWALTDLIGDRTLVISESTYPSTGRYAGHLVELPDFGEWSGLRRAIVAVLEFNMFGIPYVGVPLCSGTSSTLLCQRWIEMGAFFPLGLDFRMKRSSADTLPMTPAALEAVSMRYSLLPVLYTLFFRVSLSGGTVVRPLFFEFPLDKATYTLDEQFMWGSSILFSPILDEGVTSHSYYLPPDVWFDFKSGLRKDGSTEMMSRSVTENSTLLVHVRGGQVLPVQPTLKNTMDRTKVPYDLYVYPKDGFASGELFVDDGISQGTVESNQYDLFSFILAQNLLRVSISHFGNGTRQNATVRNIVFFDVDTPPSRVTMNKNGVAQNSVIHNSTKKSLTVTVNLQLRSLNSMSTEAVLQLY
ncbi:lysosomal alpha-glucosidase-like [Rhipicephalus microplus]|uniref:lysosomal alpha-glucosidase-like n=1 Tax=Rhipicephalus microplus TaxID=6941 RepID=UPI003F6BE97D